VLAILQVWNTNGVEGVHRFLGRAWRLFEGGLSDGSPDAEQLRLLHSTIKRVRAAVEYVVSAFVSVRGAFHSQLRQLMCDGAPP